MLNIENFLENVQPLDIVLFRGSSYFSKLITYCVEKKLNIPSDDVYSHVGIIITRDFIDDENLEVGELYVFESILSGVPASKIHSIHFPNRPVFGVQVRRLKDVIQDCLSHPKTKVGLAMLNRSSCSKVLSELNRNFVTNVYKNYLEKIYDPNPCSLCGALFKCLRPIRDVSQEITHTEGLMFCSEFVSSFLKTLKILNQNVNPSNVIPQDFLGYDMDGDIPVGLFWLSKRIHSEK